jgi:hypothetical protein
MFPVKLTSVDAQDAPHFPSKASAKLQLEAAPVKRYIKYKRAAPTITTIAIVCSFFITIHFPHRQEH